MKRGVDHHPTFYSYLYRIWVKAMKIKTNAKYILSAICFCALTAMPNRVGILTGAICALGIVIGASFLFPDMEVFERNNTTRINRALSLGLLVILGIKFVMGWMPSGMITRIAEMLRVEKCVLLILEAVILGWMSYKFVMSMTAFFLNDCQKCGGILHFGNPSDSLKSDYVFA